MKFIIILSLLFSSLVYAQEEPDDGDEAENLPALVNNMPSLPDYPWQADLSFSQLFLGGVYIGGIPTHANFSYLGADIRYQWKYIVVGGEFTTLKNQSATTTYTGSVLFGGHYREENWNFLLMGDLGYSDLEEKTSIQNISGQGPSLGLKLMAEYTYGHWVGGVGFQWVHQIFASSYWGNDLENDIVIDNLGPTFSLGYRW